MSGHPNASHFFRVIIPPIIQNGTLELPRKFVEVHGEFLPMYAHLKIPTGSSSKLELKKFNGKVWFHKGWREFVDKYSIKIGHFLVFEYEGRSRYNVRIFDLSTMEIDYQSTLTNPVKEEEDNEEEEDDEEEDDDSEQVHFESGNPHFWVIMQPSNISARRCVMNVPASAGRRFFRKTEDRNMKLEGADGRVWHVKCSFSAHPKNKVRIDSGWKEFAQENHLHKGDVCVFELICGREKTFKVTILRVNKREAPPAVESNAVDMILKREGSFKVHMTRFYVSRSAFLHVPIAHSRKYLKYEKQGEKIVILHGSTGKTWAVKYNASADNSRAAFFTNGWVDFASDNLLREGDICIFEKIFGQKKLYKVTVFRSADRA